MHFTSSNMIITRDSVCCETVTWRTKHNSVTSLAYVCGVETREITCGRQKRRRKEKIRTSNRSSVTEENRPIMKSTLQIVCAICEWNFNSFWISQAVNCDLCDNFVIVPWLYWLIYIFSSFHHRSISPVDAFDSRHGTTTFMLAILERRSGHNWSSLLSPREELPVLLPVLNPWSYSHEVSARNALWPRKPSMRTTWWSRVLIILNLPASSKGRLFKL